MKLGEEKICPDKDSCFLASIGCVHIQSRTLLVIRRITQK